MAFDRDRLPYQVAEEFEEAAKLSSTVEKRLRKALLEKDPDDPDNGGLPARRPQPRRIDEIIGR